MLKINLDMADLLKIESGISDAAKQAMKKYGDQLVAQTRAHIVEEAHKKLHTRRQMFVDALHHHQVNEDTWVISLDAKARWIDDGMPPHNMIDDLLKSKKTKRAKDGSAYLVVPFEHNKGPTQMTPAQKTLLDTVKAELKKRKIPYGKIEKNAAGEAKLGRLHSFDIKHAPLKSAPGPGTGKGPVGKVMQGPTGIPLLQGVSIYQKKVKDKAGKESVKRSIMTFRVVSSKMKGQGRWDHPGLPAAKLMEDGQEWAQRQWEQEIVPQIVDYISTLI